MLFRSDAAREALFREGYEPAYGARPLKRAVQRLLQDPLAQKILKGEALPGDHITVDAAKSGQLLFEHAAAPTAAN